MACFQSKLVMNVLSHYYMLHNLILHVTLCTHPLIQLKYVDSTILFLTCVPSIQHSPPAVNFGEGEVDEGRRLCPSHSWR